jgi:chromate transporter
VRAGLLTFGGAYTAIPFLQEDAIEGGWMTGRTFLDGVALSGVLPAPFIIFSTFVGFVAGGLLGALAMTVGIFAPAFLFTIVGHRHLERLVEHRGAHALLDGITAGVVGLIGATTLLLAPVAVRGIAGAAIFGIGLAALYVWSSGTIIAVVVGGAGVLGLVLFGVLGMSG